MKKITFFEDHQGTVTGDQFVKANTPFECSDENAKIIVANKWGKIATEKKEKENDNANSNTTE